MRANNCHCYDLYCAYFWFENMSNVSVNLIISRLRMDKLKRNILSVLNRKMCITNEEEKEAEEEILLYSNKVKSKTIPEDNIKCEICSEFIINEPLMLITCGHMVHEQCQTDWLYASISKLKCYTCGEKIRNDFILEGIWTRLIARLSIQERIDLTEKR